MHTIQIIAQADTLFPDCLRRARPVPEKMYIQSGADNWKNLLLHPRVAVVGTRRVTAYGKTVTGQIVGELARAGVVIVSGLAIGIDACAHRATLEAGGQTIAVLPSSVEEVYPRSHTRLAEHIVRQGGALVSEYPPGTTTYPVNFIARNRIVAALADVLLVTEATHKSGTLHTTRFALEQGIEVMAVPGNITSATAAGTNELLRCGATLVTSAGDVLRALGIEPQAARATPHSADPREQCLIDLLARGVQDGPELLRLSRLAPQSYNQALTMLEISGVIRPLGGNTWTLT